MKSTTETVHVPTTSEFQQLKARLHREVLDRLNLESLQQMDRDSAVQGIRALITDLMNQETTPLSTAERRLIMDEILNEIFGLGPLEPLLADPGINDILVNTFDQIYVERDGKLETTQVTFKDDNHLMQIIDRIVSRVGRRIDESSPMVDARLADGSRINAIIPPLSIDGPHLSIRKFRKDALSGEDLIRNASLTAPILELLAGCVKARLNVLVSGGTGAGKTTLLNVLSSFIPNNERIVTIEDSAELQLRQEHVVRLETRPPNIEGEGQITQRQLVINSLRMRPDRIVVGEVRSGEAIDMLQAMNTGHDGSLTTIHANTPRDALGRLETMVAMAGFQLPPRAVKEQVASAINIVVQIARHSDGVRRVTGLSEIIGMEEDVITMQEIFTYEKMGIDEEGKMVGRFRPTGIRPRFADRLRLSGIHLPLDMFDETATLEAAHTNRSWR
ncbi:MAG TPA: CpaF family protein [Candidatus Polarisedimenticolia bacterium]|jgi:pilus assembly protein CpaF|nr:CpaF family protein [Candidatus Polarisedimenticolia bacterium]